MIRLELASTTDVLNLGEQYETGVGYQAVAGATGFGLAPVSAQWLEGAGDGSRYRGRRVLSRDIDLPFDIVGRDRAHLKRLLSRLAVALSDQCTLTAVDDDGVRWSVVVVHVGGGDFTFGGDSAGERDFQTTISLRAADPYWTSSVVSQQSIGGAAGASFLSSLTSLPVASSQAIGAIDLTNTGDADAYPVWTVIGPGRHFKAIAPPRAGRPSESFTWEGTLAAGEVLTVDTYAATVTDQAGTNRYADMGTAPRLWSIPPGLSTATASLLDVTSTSKIVCSWQARRRLII